MNTKTPRAGVRIAPLPTAPDVGPVAASHQDERERDWRPGRFAVRGPFIDLSKVDDADVTTFDRQQGA